MSERMILIEYNGHAGWPRRFEALGEKHWKPGEMDLFNELDAMPLIEQGHFVPHSRLIRRGDADAHQVLYADGKEVIDVRIEVVDATGRPLVMEKPPSVSASAGKVTDVTPHTKKKGVYLFKFTVPKKPGDVEISAVVEGQTITPLKLTILPMPEPEPPAQPQEGEGPAQP